jgi:hypothetical protein
VVRHEELEGLEVPRRGAGEDRRVVVGTVAVRRVERLPGGWVRVVRMEPRRRRASKSLLARVEERISVEARHRLRDAPLGLGRRGE